MTPLLALPQAAQFGLELNIGFPAGNVITAVQPYVSRRVVERADGQCAGSRFGALEACVSARPFLLQCMKTADVHTGAVTVVMQVCQLGVKQTVWHSAGFVEQFASANIGEPRWQQSQWSHPKLVGLAGRDTVRDPGEQGAWLIPPSVRARKCCVIWETMPVSSVPQ